MRPIEAVPTRNPRQYPTLTFSLILALTSCQLLKLDEQGANADAVSGTGRQTGPVAPGQAEKGGQLIVSSPGAPIVYRLSLAGRGNHYLHVDAEFPTDGADHLSLMMPVWTPGSYLVREYAGHLESISAHGAASRSQGTTVPRELRVSKQTKNRWRVETGGAAKVVVSYELYCAQASVRSNWVGEDRAVIVGAATFLTRADALGRIHDLQIDMPPEWPHSITGLAPHPGGAPHHYQAANFDTLVDSPLVLGRAEISQFSIDGVAHRLANVGGGPMWNGPQSARAVEAIARQAIEFWGAIPYQNYTFLNLIGEGRGGLEHLNSTLMMTSRWSQGLREGFVGWMGLVSHEFFHTWNVKRMRPAPLGPFDYETEVYTRSLWIAEGLTSYYDNLLLVRAGLMTRSEYFKRLGKTIARVQSTAGRLLQSLESASFDSWIKHYRKDESSPNSQISYYSKGSLVGFVLDAKIRQATAGASSLDTVMRRAYAQFSGKVGYTPEQFQTLASDVAGLKLDSFFDNAVRGVGELDYSEAVQWYGLQLGEQEPAQAVADAGVPEPEPSKAPADPKPGYFGVRTGNEQGRLMVTHVLRDTPAWRAHLQPHDELLAIDGYRVTGNISARLRHYAPSSKIEVLISRGGKLRTLNVQVGVAPEADKQWALGAIKQPTAAQVAARDAWLGTAPLLSLQ